MVKSVDKFFRAFKVGFDMVCAGDALKVSALLPSSSPSPT